MFCRQPKGAAGRDPADVRSLLAAQPRSRNDRSRSALAGKSFSQSLEREARGGFDPFLGMHLKEPNGGIDQISRLDILPDLEPTRLRTRHADRKTICSSFNKPFADSLLCIQGALAILEQLIACHTEC
jgi:hypothetical protein